MKTKIYLMLLIVVVLTAGTAASCRHNPHEEEPCGPKPVNCDHTWPPQDPPRT